MLTGHEDAISFLAWSPDDSLIITCGNDHKVKLWNSSVFKSISWIILFVYVNN